MKNFYELWANKAQTKTITRENMLEHAILKAMKAKTEDKIGLAKLFIGKAFTPGAVCAHRYHPFQSQHEAANRVNWLFKHRRDSLFASEVLETPEEIDLFYQIITSNEVLNYGN